MEKSKRELIFLLCIVFLVSYNIFHAVTDLTNKKDVYEVNIAGAMQLLEVKSSINGIIPTGSDYYYIGFDADDKTGYIIKANADFAEHFDADNISKDEGGTGITALAKKIDDKELREELKEYVYEIQDAAMPYIGKISFPLDPDYCIDMTYKTTAYWKLVTSILLLAVWLVFAYGEHKGIDMDEKTKGVLELVLLVVTLIFLVLLR